MKSDGHKLITCVVPKGVAPGVLETLKERWGIVTANINTARGIGKITPLKYRGLGEQSEKEILTVMVEDERADDIFDFVYFEAKIDQPHGGLMYMLALQYATPFGLPDLPTEK
ncbi:MAG: hypothetical protein QF609_09400 [Gammaproteobacteria bacterium]|jgi:nitrogen regulatory protein PII|nr:hypothetical protein [Gammaproteobacteria bacterium]